MNEQNFPHPEDGARDWHALTGTQTMTILGVSAQGLDEPDIVQRREAAGPNDLPRARPVPALIRFLRQFHNALIYFLLAAALAAALLDHGVDALVIVAVVIVNAVVGFVQEGQAEKALNSIRDMIAPTARVLRAHEQKTIDARELVPGDIVLLEAGDMVPADIRILRARQLLANESILTGEALASEKGEAPVSPDAVLGDRASMLYSGTLVATGQATGIVVATGRATQIGTIAELARGTGRIATPLLGQINRFARVFTYWAMAGSALLLAYTVFVAGYPWVDALMVVVALAVGAIPEALPAVITITLALGVQRMARRNAIIRHLPAVETLGATSVICSDKTGTLTRNEMTAIRLVTACGPCNVDEPGDGEAQGQLLRALVLCNDARLVDRDGHPGVIGDPMEGALLALAIRARLHPDEVQRRHARRDEIPFDAQHRFMATLNAAQDGGVICVKGAPERILAMCSHQLGNGSEALDRPYWDEQIAGAAAQGQRVLGFAQSAVGAEMDRLGFQDLEQGLTFLGIVGFIDPPRDEAVAAVAACHSAGITVKMITGDHGDTAAAIARQIGISEAPKVVTGAQIAIIPDAELRQVAADTSVFARTSPEDKLRIVRALQADGAVVAMTGDGVNDAPSLKQADIGIAMGRKGTEAAKEAAQMVLVDDNFATIVAAVREGRAVHDNIRKVIAWTLPTNGGEVLCIVLAIWLGLALPLSPVQILWINLVTSVTLGLTLAFEPPEPGIMDRPPRERDAPLIPAFLIWRICLVSVLFAAGVFAVHEYGLRSGLGQDGARTMAVNALIAMETFYLFNVRYLNMSSLHLRGILSSPAVLLGVVAIMLLQLAMTYLPVLQRLFGTRALSGTDLAVVMACGIAAMVVLELEKAIVMRWGKLRGRGAG